MLEEKVLTGISISEGIAIGCIHYVKERKEVNFPEVNIPASDIEKEIDRYRKALRSSRLDLEEIQIGLAKEGSIEAVTIIDSHIRMLEDPFMTTLMEEKIRKMLLNTEVVFHTAITEYEKQFSKMQDAFFRQRLIDVQDLSQRIMRHLFSSLNSFDHDKIRQETLMLSKEFSPSQIAEAPAHTVTGFIANFGSPTAHAGLIARSKGIPFIAHFDEQILKEEEGAHAIIDGFSGKLILHPSEETLERYREKQIAEQQKNEAVFNLDLLSMTQDGRSIAIYANIDTIADLADLHRFKADGVGLVRSELLFFEEGKNRFSEESQHALYAKIFEQGPFDRLVFRVFDFGGDKRFYSEFDDGVNPALSLRSIRFLLRFKQIFRTQLRALFKAAQGKKISLLIPFVADVEEILEAREVVDQVIEELKGVVVVDLEIGAMIEMPSAVILCHQICDHVDFLSVGTNDLIQYTLVADRQNASMQDVFKSTHPSIITMLKMIVEAAHEKNKPVCICGEIASNPLFTPLLIGLGFDALSCSMRYIPKVKKIMMSVDSLEAQALTQEILNLRTATEIHRLLADVYCQYQP